MSEADRVLGQWADDPRSLEGARALGMLNPDEGASNQWASREFQTFNDDDPKSVAARAARVHARRPDRLFEPGGQPQSIKPVREEVIFSSR